MAGALIAASAACVQFVVPVGAQAVPEATPSDANPTVAAAAAVAKAEATGEPVGIPSLTTETETVEANPSGTLTLTESVYPTRVKRGGAWVAVDPTLHVAADGSLVPKAVPSGAVLSGGGDAPLATLTSYGKQLAITWPGTLPTPTVAGNTATYADVLPGVDLRASVSERGGYSEVLVVKSAEAAANPDLATITLGTETTGLQLGSDDAGNLTATDPTGAAFFSSPAATMWDSSSGASTEAATSTAARSAAPADTPAVAPAQPSSPDGPGDQAQTAEIPAHLSSGHLTLTPDTDVLRGAQTHYPVYIDPSWNPDYASDPRQYYDEIQEGCPDKNALNSTDTPYDTPGVGNNDYSGCKGIEEAFFQFKTDTRLWDPSVKIINATFKATEVYAASLDCSYSSNVQVKLSSPISLSTTWNRRPTLSTLQDTKSFGSTCTTNPSQGFDVTNAFTSAAAGHWTGVPLGMVAADESNAKDFRRFNNNPTVTVQYDSVPTVSSSTTSPASVCSGGTTLGRTSTALNTYVSDADQGAPVQAKFTLLGKDSTGTIVYPPGGTTARANEPATTVTGHGTVSWVAGYLPTGTYTWTAQADDGKYLSAATTCHFTVDATAPGAPTITSPDFGGDLAPPQRTPGDFDFHPPVDAAGNPATDIDHYAYSWGIPPATVNPPLTVPAAPNGATTSKTLTPLGYIHDVLYVYAVDTAGNQSPVNHFDFNTQQPTVADATGDFSGDGNPDLVVPGANGDVRLYQGSGTGALSQPLVISKGGGFTGAKLAVGSFRGWGEQDILAITADGQAWIYYGNGDAEPLPSFAPTDDSVPAIAPQQALLPQDPATFTWSQVSQIAAADDGQGDPPSLWVVTNDGTLWWVPGTWATGSFDAPVQLATGWQNKTLTYAGMTGQHPSLWVRDTATGELDLYTGDDTTPAGGATSTKITTATSGWTTAAHPQLFSAGIDANGNPQLWATDAQALRDVRFYPAGSKAGTLSTGTWEQTLNPPGDITGDGASDIFTIDTAGDQWIHLGTAGVTRSDFIARIKTGVGWSGKNSVDIGDINGDQRPDILARNTSDNSLWVYPNTGGTGTSTFGSPYKIGEGFGGKNIIEVADINGDGTIDILTRNTSDNSLWVYPNTGGTGTSTYGAPYKVGDAWGNEPVIKLGDINSDGLIDILCIDTAGNQYVYPGTGQTGTSTFGARYLTGTGWGGKDIVSISDVNSDGRPDILARRASDGVLSAYPNAGGTGTSSFTTPYQIGANWSAMTYII